MVDRLSEDEKRRLDFVMTVLGVIWLAVIIYCLIT